MLWHHVFHLGHRYTITGLSMSSLKKSGQMVFVTSASSCLLPYCAEPVRKQLLNSAWQGESTQSSFIETAEQLTCSLRLGAEEERPTMESKIISYTVRIHRLSLHPLMHWGFSSGPARSIILITSSFSYCQACESLILRDSLQFSYFLFAFCLGICHPNTQWPSWSLFTG